MLCHGSEEEDLYWFAMSLSIGGELVEEEHWVEGAGRRREVRACILEKKEGRALAFIGIRTFGF